jgi:hypothetical protein
MRLFFASIPLLLLLLPVPATLGAQTILGRLVDDATGRPVSGATVTLLDALDTRLTRVVTDESGRFLLVPRGAGEFRVEAARIGYATAMSPELNLARGERAEIELRLAVDAVRLDAIIVTGRTPRGRLTPGRELFERRQQQGAGVFLRARDILASNPRFTTDALATAEGMRTIQRVPRDMRTMSGAFVPRGGGGLLASEHGWGCMYVLVDGMPLKDIPGARIERGMNTQVTRRGMQGGEVLPELRGESLDTDYLPRDIAGVEIYRSIAEVPPELKYDVWHDPNARYPCGLIVVWTHAAW